MRHESTIDHESASTPGVILRIARMSLARRIDLTRRIRDLGARCEFLQAGKALEDQIEAALLSNEIDRTYLEWGLLAVVGLEIDGEAATPGLLVAKGPEDLCREAVTAIKAECHLTDEERKN
jgi:hypothetical protein